MSYNSTGQLYLNKAEKERQTGERHTDRQTPNHQAEGSCCEAKEMSQDASHCPTVRDGVCGSSPSTRRVFHRTPGRATPSERRPRSPAKGCTRTLRQKQGRPTPEKHLQDRGDPPWSHSCPPQNAALPKRGEAQMGSPERTVHDAHHTTQPKGTTCAKKKSRDLCGQEGKNLQNPQMTICWTWRMRTSKQQLNIC